MRVHIRFFALLCACAVLCACRGRGGEDTASLAATGEATEELPNGETQTPRECENSVLSFSVLPNGETADGGIEYTIDGGDIYALYSYLISEESLGACTPRVTTDGGEYAFSSNCLNKDGTIDLRTPCTLTLTDRDGLSRVYTVTTRRISYELPCVNIYTSDGAQITSREEYADGVLTMSGGYAPIDGADIQIRGRGHSTWKWDKKPYKIKFSEKTSVFGLSARRDWVLLANHADKSLIRNTVAHELSALLDGLRFTLHQYPVDLFINGTYRGVYTMGEQIETGVGRIDIDEDYSNPDTGYLLEVGGSDDEVDVVGKDFFHTETVFFIRIKSPDTSVMSAEHFEFISAYVSAADRAIRNLDGYEEYIDIPSFIDWFILHELSYNLDSCFRRSCYLVKEAGGRLCMSPVWDFDLAFGNFSQDNDRYDDLASCGNDDEDDYIKTTWFDFLLRDERFVDALRERWQQVGKRLLEAGTEAVDRYARLVAPGAQLNFCVWDIMNVRVGFQPRSMVKLNTFELQTAFLKDFIASRYEYLERHINN